MTIRLVALPFMAVLYGTTWVAQAQSAATKSVDTVVIPSAYENEGLGKLLPECNVKHGAPASQLVARLFVQKGVLGHLSSGKACAQCITFGTVKPCREGASCIDTDMGDKVSFAAAAMKLAAPVAGSYRTRLDIPLNKFVWKKANYKAILLKVVLLDPHMTFLRSLKGRATSRSSINAIRAGEEDDSKDMFTCRQPIETGTHESVSFRILYPKSLPANGSINIGISVADQGGFTLPIILDPKVPNSG